MPRMEIDLNPVLHITTDAIGQPGKRVFYIQGQDQTRVVTLIIEKIQIQTLALGVEDFLSEISQRFPNLSESTPEYDETLMRIQPPVDPLFRVGELALAYDSDNDLAILIANEINLSEDQSQEIEGAEDAPLDEADEADAIDESVDAEGTTSVVRFWCTRSQLRALCRWGLEVAEHGRPICPYCGQPMDPAGHFCPKRNGHKH
jgi:uncharacterized repeat protein (TIGR03847 family)